MPVTTQVSKNDETLTAATNNFTLKSEVTESGDEKDIIKGFLATTHLDKGNDEFTEEALMSMAEDINEAETEVEAKFRNIDEEALEEALTGNIDHDTNPAAPFGDTRTVPAFKITEAEVRDTPDDEKGLWIKGVLNSDGLLPETVSAIKNSIKEGFLDSFSVEFIPEKVEQVTRGERIVRIIKDAAAKGAAITGRPMNPGAQLTDAVMKSMATEYKVEYAYDVGDEVAWDSSGGRTSGTVRERTKDSCFNEEIDGDMEVCGSEEDPAYLIEVDNEDETMVGHKQSTLSGKSLKAEIPEDERVPPQAAQENAQMALDAKEETDNPNDCGTETGWTRAEQLVEGEPLSVDVISKMAQFARHEDNKEQGEEGRADCGWMMWKAWGGDEGVEWAQNLMEQVEGRSESMNDEEVKAVIQTPEYSATSTASWEKPAEEDFPDDYDVLDIFIVRRESDNFSDQALPVVDYRDEEATLVLEALRSAYDLAPQVEDLEDEEIERARNTIQQLAQREFDEDFTEQNGKNNVSPMSEDDVDQEPEEGEQPEDGESGEVKSLTEDVEELKSKFEEVKTANEELREENEELKSELEELKTLQEVKEDLDEVKSILDDVPLEDGPRARQQKSRFEEQSDKPRWQKSIDGMQDAEGFFESEEKMKTFAEVKNVDFEEVKDYVNGA